ncbi:hypothetical protein N0V90_009753 [Kalmusia sp. IMI 367209]|nr:hypothetical protein N0V90_009753 [Kalmusia sp. IMI 367209]
MTSSTNFKPLGEAPRDIEQIIAQERASQLPVWNSSIAYRLGTALYNRLITFPSSSPACIHISTVSTPPHVLYHTVTHSGTELDNDYWIMRKRNAVIRFGASTWRLHVKNQGNEEEFAKKGVEWPVGVVVVSGLKQWDDHMVVIEELAGICKALEAEGN